MRAPNAFSARARAAFTMRSIRPGGSIRSTRLGPRGNGDSRHPGTHGAQRLAAPGGSGSAPMPRRRASRRGAVGTRPARRCGTRAGAVWGTPHEGFGGGFSGRR
ncbi:hypothetical protein GCM10010389_36160 [Streptomyces echinoruber]|uniref:Uncharacterized protein n=1 Tax=Streptomyces echinoruber TaxID=68898 RepID=A0A918RCY0_9ACTN|nr:hypothetical protein GCM10010389_36160 [Streptomyces echinoruber]